MKKIKYFATLLLSLILLFGININVSAKVLTYNLAVGENFTISIGTYFPSAKFASEDTSICTVKYSTNGLISVKPKRAGSTYVNGIAKYEDSYLIYTFKINVYKKVVISKISLPKSMTIELKDVRSVTPNTNPRTAPLTGLKWSSSNKKIATVDKYGNIKGIKIGKCKVTVTTKNNKKATMNIVVTKRTTKNPIGSYGYEPDGIIR